MRTKTKAAGLCMLGIACLFVGACGSNTTTPAEAQAEVDDLGDKASSVIERFKSDHPDWDAYYDGSAGYAVFPVVGKGAFIVGGAYGKGVAYENADPDFIVGRCSISQGTLGLQAGGQKFSEIIFFEDDEAFTRFKEGRLEVSAAASAVAGGEGVTGKARYSKGVAVFVLDEEGLMAEASIGGQKFKYTPM